MSALTALKKSFQENYGTVREASSSDTSEETAADDVAPAVGELALEEDAAGGLGRHLGLIGRIIGTGIFSTPSSITDSVGSVGAALLLWTFGLLLAFAGLFIWLELGCMIPRSGGSKVYLEAAYKRPKLLATVVFAFQAILLGFTASGCIIFASNILVAAGRTATEWEKRGIAIFVITFVTILHTFFPKLGVRGMNFIGLIKIFTLLFIVVTGWVVLSGGVSKIEDPHASFRNAFAGSATSGNLYATALFKVLNSYAGWSNAANVLNEVRNPVRTLKIAGPLGLSTCGILYLLANISYFSAATPQEISRSGVTVASYFVGKVFNPAAERALSALVAISALGNVMTVTFAQSRVNQELAKEGVVPYPRFWASSWPLGSPSAGLFLHYIPSFVVIVAVPFGDAYSFILDVEGYPGSVMNFFVVVGFFWLRRAAPDLPRPFRCWWPVAAFYLAAQVFLLVAPFLRPPGGKGDTSLPYWLYPIVGIVILLGGVVYWAVWWKFLPWYRKYTLVPEHERLSDGTRVVVYKKLRKE
ncbi:Amino acid/polyamine transporter I [Neofusicoccum parvum]|nr:Amino acid/polyamine transporter I [Neofusicoccum parvum]